jgi:hypothetical protein
MNHNGIERAVNEVFDELRDLGLLTRKLFDVNVVSHPIDVVGYQGLYVEQPSRLGRILGFEKRSIYIPRSTWKEMFTAWAGRRCRSVRDAIRHELAHAFAAEHQKLVRRNPKFTAAFGAREDTDVEWEYDPGEHVTEYAATSPAEDFAETFMTYVRVGGKIGRFKRRAGVYRKLQFCRRLQTEVKLQELT